MGSKHKNRYTWCACFQLGLCDVFHFHIQVVFDNLTKEEANDLLMKGMHLVLDVYPEITMC